MEEEQRRLAEELLFSEKKKQSFAKKLYFGVLDTESVFPYPSPSHLEEIATYAGKVRAFAAEKVDPDWIDRNAQIPGEVIEGLRELGVFGMTVPEKYGGLGMSQHAYCRISEVLAQRCASTALLVNAHQSIGLKALLLFGTEEQREKWLRAMATGEKIGAFSLTEKNAGSDASGVESRAVYDPEQNVYVINGKKQWTTSGSIAQVLTVMARTEVETEKGIEDKITAFLITPDMPGFIIVDPSLEKVGMRGTQTANLEFKDMVVPAENVLGPVGAGLRVCLTVLDYGRTTFGATCTGTAKVLLERAREHARTRHQFKRPIGSFPLVKKKVALIAALTYAMDATTYLTAGLIDQGVEDVMLEAAMLKVFTSDSLWTIIYETMQIMGGLSFFKNEPMERMMRDARLNMIGEGANEVLRAFIGVVGMRDVGVQLQEGLRSLVHPIACREEMARMVHQIWKQVRLAKIPLKTRLFKEEADALARAVRKFGWNVIRVLGQYKEKVVERQLDLDRIATAAMGLYTMTAVLGKVDHNIAFKTANEEEIETARFYCKMALHQIHTSLDRLFDPFDKEIEAFSDRVTGLEGR